MYYVGKFDESKFAVPHAYAQHSRGYERVSLVDHTVGSVHMGVGISQLQPRGIVESCVHAYETGIYVLEGELEMMRGQEAFRLTVDDFALIPYGVSHAFRNAGVKHARWFEMQAPQPKPASGWQDTYFEGDAEWPAQVDHLIWKILARGSWDISRIRNRRSTVKPARAGSRFGASSMMLSARSIST